MSSTITTIRDGMETEIQTLLGAGWKELQYKENVQKNNLRTSSERFGVLAKASSETLSVTKYLTFSQSFEVILTKKYNDSKMSINDSQQIQAGMELRDLALDIYKQFYNSKAGAPSVVINITDLEMSEAEYLEDDKVVILRSTMNVVYRESLI